MRLKTFVAQNLQEALAQVKRDLGPEAVILSTQSCRLGQGKSGGGRRVGVEVTAAVDHPLQAEVSGAASSVGNIFPAPGASLRKIQQDLEELKGIFRHWLRQNGPPAWLYQHRELVTLFRAMVRSGLAESVLWRWLEDIKHLVSQPTLGNLSLQEASLQCMMRLISVLDPWQSRPPGRRLWTFIGPTGVGKTTTLAKLAVRFALINRQRVGIISLDSQRLGAADQLAAFTRIADLPLQVVQGREDLANALDAMAELDVVLIDTPGRSPYYPALAMELHQLLGGYPDLKHHLVLSAAAHEGHLADAIRGFSVASVSSCIITKIDESRGCAHVVNQLCQQGLPLSYLATGQRVPEDLELATPRMITELVLQERIGDDHANG